MRWCPAHSHFQVKKLKLREAEVISQGHRAGEQPSRARSRSSAGVHTPHHGTDPIHCAEWKTDHAVYRTQPLPLYARC